MPEHCIEFIPINQKMPQDTLAEECKVLEIPLDQKIFNWIKKLNHAIELRA
jgi:hypothetical protein